MQMEITVRGENWWVEQSFCEVVLRFLNRLATGVLAITTYFHHMRLLRLFTVLAAILAIFLSRAITRGMRAFVSLIFCHKTILLSDGLLFVNHPRTQNLSGQGRNVFPV